MGNCYGSAKDSSLLQTFRGGGVRRIARSGSSSSVDSGSCASWLAPSPRDGMKKQGLIRDGLELLPESRDGVPRFKLVISKEQVDAIASGQYHPSKIDYLDHLVTTMLREELKKMEVSRQ